MRRPTLRPQSPDFPCPRQPLRPRLPLPSVQFSPTVDGSHNLSLIWRIKVVEAKNVWWRPLWYFKLEEIPSISSAGQMVLAEVVEELQDALKNWFLDLQQLDQNTWRHCLFSCSWCSRIATGHLIQYCSSDMGSWASTVGS